MTAELPFQVVDSIPIVALNLGLVTTRELVGFSHGETLFGDRKISIHNGQVEIHSSFGVCQLQFPLEEGYSLAYNLQDTNDKKLYIKYNNGSAIIPMFLANYLRELSKKNIDSVKTQSDNLKTQVGDILGVQGH